MLNINTVTIIGATGTMGANVAGIFASFGDAKVYYADKAPSIGNHVYIGPGVKMYGDVILTKGVDYDPAKMLGDIRRPQIQAA